MALLTRAALLLAPRRTVREAFRRHFVRRDWLEPETVSGRGSALARTASIRRELSPLLERPPFALGPPLRLLGEGESVEDAAYRDKSLGLWRLAPP